MKRFIVIVVSFILGILLGYYWGISVEREIRQKLYEHERQEQERREKERERLLKIFNGEGEWQEYIMEEMMNGDCPV